MSAVASMPIAEEAGKVFATAGENKVEIKVDPADAEETAKDEMGTETITGVKIIEYNDEIVYEVAAEKEVKVLALIKADMPIKAIVDVDSGELIKIQKPWWAVISTGD